MAKVSNREFVVAWCRSKDMAGVMDATDMQKAAITARACFLRKRGVKLPKMHVRRGLDAFEIATLNSLIKKHTSDV